MAFELVPGTRHLALPWLWLVEGAVSAPCLVAVGTGEHEGVAAVCPDGMRGHLVRGPLGGTVDLGAGFGPASIPGLYNGAPVVTEGSRFLFRSVRWGWVVARALAEPAEWDEETTTWTVSGSTVASSTSTARLGDEFWKGPTPSALFSPAEFSPAGSLRDSGAAIAVELRADLSRRTGMSAAARRIPGAYETLAGQGAGVPRIGEFEPAGVTHVYPSARLL